jgi:hypothetical protein
MFQVFIKLQFLVRTDRYSDKPGLAQAWYPGRICAPYEPQTTIFDGYLPT